MNFFITGTDTDVGKTHTTALLTRAFRRAGYPTIAMKPLASGGWNDAEILSAAADHLLTPEEITPFSCKAPLSPMQAAEKEGKVLLPQEIILSLERMKKIYPSMLIEGVGGWKVPLTYDFTTADLAAAIGFPVLLVVRNRLGAKNHALLTLESIKSHGLHCAGVILNHLPSDAADPAIPGYREFFKNFSRLQQLPFLEVLPNQAEIDISYLERFK